MRFNFSVRNGKRWSPHAVITLISFFYDRPSCLDLHSRPVFFSARRSRRGVVAWKSDLPGAADTLKTFPLQALTSVLIYSILPSAFPFPPCGSVSFATFRIFSFLRSFRAISTARLNVSPRLHLRPIDVVVSDGPYARSYLEAGFVLRCFQHLSCPDAATRLCSWRNNRCTGGLSSTVLSY